MPYRLKIKERREAAKMSQKDLAAAIGMNASQFSLIESRKRDLRVGQLLQVAAALGVSASELLGGCEPSAFALKHDDLAVVKTPQGPRPYAVAESRGRVYLLPMTEGEPLDPANAEILSVERGGAL